MLKSCEVFDKAITLQDLCVHDGTELSFLLLSGQGKSDLLRLPKRLSLQEKHLALKMILYSSKAVKSLVTQDFHKLTMEESGCKMMRSFLSLTSQLK